MKKQIYDIIFAAQYEGLNTKEATDKLLLLFSVSGRSELLRAYFKWHKEKGFVSHKDSDIDEFLASNSH